MKSIKPTIKGLEPSPPIVINVEAGKVLGKSGKLQLLVQLKLTGGLPATAIASLEILSPQLYLFADGTSKKQYSILIDTQQETISLEFNIKNLAFFKNPQPTLDVGIYTWEKSTGQSIKASDFAHIAVTVVRPVAMKFKNLLN